MTPYSQRKTTPAHTLDQICPNESQLHFSSTSNDCHQMVSNCTVDQANRSSQTSRRVSTLTNSEIGGLYTSFLVYCNFPS